MKINSFTQEEVREVGELTKHTNISALTILKRLEAMYTANLVEDVKSIIEDIEEEESN